MIAVFKPTCLGRDGLKSRRRRKSVASLLTLDPILPILLVVLYPDVNLKKGKKCEQDSMKFDIKRYAIVS